MRINRRQFLKGSSASAFLAGTNLLGLATRRAAAATANGRAVVMINLSGGNDYLNMVVPLSDVAGYPQRTRYESGRPDLAIPTALLGATQIGNDAVLGHQIALHPQMTGLATLYQESKLAVVNGVGYPNHSLSHFEAEATWWAGNPMPQGTGWLGRFLDTLPSEVTHALSFGGDVNPTLTGASADALGVREIQRFDLPDDREGEYQDLEFRRPAWTGIFADDRDPAAMLGKIARAGENLIEKSLLFDEIVVDGWGSLNEEADSDLAFQLQQVASALRHDLQNAGNPSQQTGLSFFHAQIGGFDTHSQQGRDDPGAWHPTLMRTISQAMTNFQRDLEGLGLQDKVITIVYSEFGRRIDQNDSGNSAGTDHGTANAMLVMGDATVLNGGMYGQMPDLSEPDNHDNMVISVDFRRVYASVIAEWLGGNAGGLIGPYAPMGLFVPA